MTVKCTKCPTIIEDGEGRYNYPSGVQCNDCGKDYHDKHSKRQKGCRYIITF